MQLANVFPAKETMNEIDFRNLQIKEKLLPYEQYKPYFIALRENDVPKVYQMLSKAHPVEKDAMLNGVFDFGRDPFIPPLTLAKLSKPLFIATVFASIEVLELLLKEGADIFQENITNGNILHSLVAGSSIDESDTLQDRAVLIVKKLVSILDQSQMRKLLMHENSHGLRPMELAVNLGCLCLYECMQLTPGVYVPKTLDKGVLKEEWIDVTEYESYEPGHRRVKSPTFLFSFLDKTILSSPKNKAILESDLVALWIDTKMNCNRFVLLLWFICRVLYATLFYVYITKGQGHGDHGQPSTKSSNNASITAEVKGCKNEYMYFEASPLVVNFMVTYLIFHSVLSLVTSGIAFKQFKHDNLRLFQMKLNGKEKHCIMDYSFYVVNNILTNLTYVLGGVLALFDLQETRTLVNMLVILTCTTSVWSVLYFVQILPSIGHFVISIQRMIWVLFHFIVVFGLTFLPFPHAFYRLLQGKDGCPNHNFSSNVPITYYNTFTVLLNMVDFTQFESNLSRGDYIVLLCLHISYVFILSILLINFLIALLSTSVAEIHEHRTVVMILQKLCVISQTERHILHMPYLRSLHKHLQSKQFHVVDGRIYLIRITLDLHKKGK